MPCSLRCFNETQAQRDFQLGNGQRKESWFGEAFRCGVPREMLLCGGDARSRHCFSRLQHALTENLEWVWEETGIRRPDTLVCPHTSSHAVHVLISQPAKPDPVDCTARLVWPILSVENRQAPVWRRLTALIATPRYGSRLSSCLMRDSSFLTAWPTLVLSGVHPPLPLAYKASLVVSNSTSACGCSCKRQFR